MIVVRVHEHDHPVSHPVEDFPCLIGRSLKSAIRIDEPNPDSGLVLQCYKPPQLKFRRSTPKPCHYWVSWQVARAQPHPIFAAPQMR